MGHVRHSQPLLGDVSLNGQVLAYDASLVLQWWVGSITLQPLQLLVADVSGTSGVTAFDATLILEFVAGVIPAFPAVSNGATHAPPPDGALAAAIAAAKGSFQVSLGAPVQVAEGWDVPVNVTGTAPIWALGLELSGPDAARLTTVSGLAAGASHAEHAGASGARIAVASPQPIGSGEVMRLHFSGDGALSAPKLELAIVNETTVIGEAPKGPATPAISMLAPPAPNPTRGPATLSLAVAASESGRPASLKILDVAGRTLRVLHDGPLAAGIHPFAWDLRDDAGSAVPAGIYFVRATTGGVRSDRRLVVVR